MNHVQAELGSSSPNMAHARRRDPLSAAPARSELPDQIRRPAQGAAAGDLNYFSEWSDGGSRFKARCSGDPASRVPLRMYETVIARNENIDWYAELQSHPLSLPKRNVRGTERGRCKLPQHSW